MKKQLFFAVILLCLVGMTMQAQQRKVLFEQFTSSTCGPCYSMNLWLTPLLQNNADKVVVVKYQMSWPAPGDPYYTLEGYSRRVYYSVNSVPSPFTNGVSTGNQSAITNAINNGYAQPAEATITGTFKVNGNNIIINGNVTPLISGTGYKIYVVVNEKITKNNKMTNGETEFHHVMMKMFPDGNGTSVTLTSGTPIPFSYTYDMSTTHVEEMDDLEVAVFVQNVSTRGILNAAYLEDITPAPVNMTATQVAIDSKDVNITWQHPTGVTVEGYNIYRNNVKINSSLVTGTSYLDQAPEFGKTYTYTVEIVVGGEAGYKKSADVLINITIPQPINVTVKQIRGLKMLVTWEQPANPYALQYTVYRNDVPQNYSNPTTETTFENTGLTYREYCFDILPFLNEVTGPKSAKSCVTLINVPTPENLIVKQISPAEKDVLLTWTASTSNTAGYNLYRDNVKINTELITEPTYTDIVPDFNIEYTYQLYGVAANGGESQNAASAKITLYYKEIPVPQNVNATQQGNVLIVSVTWDAATMDIDGYNIYRNDEKINPELLTETEYTDNVPEEGNYCYEITIVMDGGEGEKSEPACVDVSIVNIDESDKDALFTLFPNPVSGTLYINTKEPITDCQIYNIQGQLIYSTKSNIKEISTDSWASGIYIIRITTEKGNAEKRFMKN